MAVLHMLIQIVFKVLNKSVVFACNTEKLLHFDTWCAPKYCECSLASTGIQLGLNGCRQ